MHEKSCPATRGNIIAKTISTAKLRHSFTIS
jgi:hypothetical protein